MLRLVGLILLGHLLLAKVMPWANRRWLGGRGSDVVPGTDGYSKPALLAAVAIFVGWSLLSQGGLAAVGLVGWPDASLGALGLGILWIWRALSAVATARERQLGNAFGLSGRRAYLTYAAWTALLWAGVREEIYFRGWITGAWLGMGLGPWGLLVPLLYFAHLHAYNPGGFGRRVLWAVAALPGSLVYSVLLLLTGSVWTGVVVHALANAVGVLEAAAERPRLWWNLQGALLLAGAGLVAWQWPALTHVAPVIGSRLITGLGIYAGPGLLGLGVLVLGTWLIDRGWKAVMAKRVTARGGV